jgi:hypothetical protein
VQNIIAPIQSGLPAVISGQIGGKKSEVPGISGGGNGVSYSRLFREIAYGGTRYIATLEKLNNTPTGDISISTRYKNCFSHIIPAAHKGRLFIS